MSTLRLGPTTRPPQKPAKPSPAKAAKQASAPAPKPTGVRLSKCVMALLQCSRSDAERIICAGHVRVDGQVVDAPPFRVLQQAVTVDPGATAESPQPMTLLLHKPAQWQDGCGESAAPGQDARSLLTPAQHLARDPSGIRPLAAHLRQLLPLVELERAASGLVVFSQDWRVQRKLQEDRATLEHEWLLDVLGTVGADTVQRLQHTLQQQGLHGKVSLGSSQASHSRLRLAVKGSHPGLVAFLCERVGLQIQALERIRLGRVGLGKLPPGQWRYLGAMEKF